MDYVYGELNAQAEKNVYSGGSTSSADVTVDNINNVITVIAHLDSSDVQNQIIQYIHNHLNKADSAVSGQFVTSVSETDGVITVTRSALTPNDIPSLNANKIYVNNSTNLLPDVLAGKQENLGFEGAYDKNLNKVVTKIYLDQTIEHLQGSMHYLGITTTPITEGSTITQIEIGGVMVTVQKSDLVGYPTYETKWFFNGTSWSKYEDTSIYIESGQGQVTNADIVDAALSNTKINGLPQTTNRVNILVADDQTPGSVAKQIKDAIEALDYSDTQVSHQFVTVVSEADGVISVQRAALVKSDIPNIDESQVISLTEDLVALGNRITALTPDTCECEGTEYIYKVWFDTVNNKLKVEKRNLVEANIPTLSYTKISGLAAVAHTGSYIDLSDKPTITYNGTDHYLLFTGI